MDLGQLEPLVDPGPYLFLLAEQYPPARPVAIWAGGPDGLADLADQLVGELGLVAVADEAHLDGGGDVTAGRLAIDPTTPGRRALPVAPQPPAEHFSYLDHCYLPECQGGTSSLGWVPQAQLFKAGQCGTAHGGPMIGNQGGPMSLAKPALKWSLLGGTRQTHQATRSSHRERPDRWMLT